ncbi:MAG TPA: hypothetical protein DEB40_02620 [Elusimicrobia bacterium]|nr:hypothetical protein [Elusimicrobiota bacterium]HBT60624.1 hypothetical protein [Elusimicrobiota bacterium]
MNEFFRRVYVSCAVIFISLAAQLAWAQGNAAPAQTGQPAVEKAVEAAAKPAEAAVKTPEAVAKPAESPVKSPEAAAQPAQPQVQPAEAPAKPVEIAPAAKKEPEKALATCAQHLTPLADGYRQAYERMRQWMREISDRTTAADEKVKSIQTKIQDNEATITKLKVEAPKANKSRIKDLSRDNKQLWKDLEAAKKETVALRRSVSKTLNQKVKETSDEIKGRLAEVQKRLAAQE